MAKAPYALGLVINAVGCTFSAANPAEQKPKVREPLNNLKKTKKELGAKNRPFLTPNS